MNFHNLKIILQNPIVISQYRPTEQKETFKIANSALCFILFLLFSSLYFLHSPSYLTFISTIIAG